MRPPRGTQWPRTLWIVRHGQSAGNVARDSAEAAGLPVIDIAERDIDVPLSELGRRQATALGHWFGELPPDRRPDVLLCSPYVRARETARRHLNYVYVGNVGAEWVNTHCPACGELVIDRLRRASSLTADKKCPRCGSGIAVVGEVRF